jgi:hypothetical protein
MWDSLVERWKYTVSTLWVYVNKLNAAPSVSMPERHKVEMKVVEDGLLVMITSSVRNFSPTCTRQNLVFLSNSWDTFDHCSRQPPRYWRTRFPEWSYMITQFHVFVNERAMTDMTVCNWVSFMWS